MARKMVTAHVKSSVRLCARSFSQLFLCILRKLTTFCGTFLLRVDTIEERIAAESLDKGKKIGKKKMAKLAAKEERRQAREAFEAEKERRRLQVGRNTHVIRAASVLELSSPSG